MLKKNQQGFSVIEILVILVIFGLVGIIGWLVYERQQPVPTTSTATTPSSQKSTSELKPLKPVDEMLSETLFLIKESASDNGEYPETLTSDMTKNLWRYNYNQMAGGPTLKCPQDSRYFTYTGYKDIRTKTIDTFELYYCDGSTLSKKTQLDI